MSDSAELLFKQKINHQLTCKLSRKSVNAFLDESFNFLLPGMINCEFKNYQELSIALQTHLNNLKKILPENLNDEIAKKYEKLSPYSIKKFYLMLKLHLMETQLQKI